jgi:hypothetical protein
MKLTDSGKLRKMTEAELEVIFSNADKFCAVVRSTVNVELGFDEEGVRWTDGFIFRNRERWSDESKRLYLFAIGAYLGECLRQRFKGSWVYHEAFGPGVQQRTGIDFPFNKVGKQIAGEEGASILSMFEGAIALDRAL